jgi:hypothetical protein
VQGLIPAGAQLPRLDGALVLVSDGATTSSTTSSETPSATPELSPPSIVSAPPTPTTDPLIGGSVNPQAPSPVDVLVGSGDIRLLARDDQAERFRLGYAWGRQLSISGFDPLHDVIDLRGFWGEGQQAQVLGTAEGVRVDLPFNQQSVLLPGVSLDQWSSQALQIWAG